jgi:superfamily II DNA/RNA helicase
MNNSNPQIAAVLNNMGIEQLNEMQQTMLTACNKPKDILLLSPTGTGKTLAYLLPLFLQIQPEAEGVQALIVAPSRELAQQIEQVWRSMATGFRVLSCFGGRPSNNEKRELLKTPALLIGTPGRLQDHIERENFSTDSIRTLVLDEFDKSLEMGFSEQMEAIIGRIPSLKKRILTSATDALKIPAFTGVTNPEKLDYSLKDNTLPGLKTYVLKGLNNDKYDLLYRLLCYLGNHSSLVFCNQRDEVEKLSAYLTTRKLSNEFFHGKMEQPDREKALSKFRNGSCCVFISTDLASRGLDIPEIKQVIHFDIPVRLDEYIHRNGRTARMEAQGSAYSLLTANATLPDYIKPTPQPFLLPALVPAPPVSEWKTLYIGKGKKDKLSKMDVVGFLFKKGLLEREDLGLVEVKEYYSYVAVKAGRMKSLLKNLENEKIKNMKVKVEEAL